MVSNNIAQFTIRSKIEIGSYPQKKRKLETIIYKYVPIAPRL